jgi:hypothetical protein
VERFDNIDPYAAMLNDFVDAIRCGAVDDAAWERSERRVRLSADLLSRGQAARTAA